MKKIAIIRKIAMLISLVLLLTSTFGSTYGFIITSTQPIINTFVPDDVIENGLCIYKIVEHPFGDDYVIPQNISFDFKIELGSYYANTRLETSAGEIVTDQDGSLTANIKPNGVFSIDGIDEGTVVTVTELETALIGFSPKENPAKTVTVGADGNALVTFVNTYTPKAAGGSAITIEGEKILTGRDWQSGDSFGFKLEQENTDNEWVLLDIQTVEYSNDADFNKFSFNDALSSLSFDKIGVYNFRISEIAGELDNIDYDKTVNTFAVRVTDTDMDGALEICDVVCAQNITANRYDGKYVLNVEFNNSFIPELTPDDLIINLNISKTVKNTGKVSITAQGFEFILENCNTGEKMSAVTDKDGKATFNPLYTVFDVGKTYNYKLYEKNGDKYGVTYDDTVYDISVKIALDDNQLFAKITMNGNSVKNCVAEFENIYHNNETDSPASGDSNRINFWFILMLISGSAFVVLAIFERKHQYIAKH